VHHLRTLRPADGVRAFYDGRIEGYRFADDPNWVDDGALALGIASYAIVDGDEALIYDTHVSVEHARFVRSALEAEGVRRFVVLLSHCHLDHVAGTAAFADCEVIATARTAELLIANKRAIEAGALSGPPGIDPLVLPTLTFEDRISLDVGRLRLEVMHVNIHSDDAAVVWMAQQDLLLAGDTMEDTVTYVAEAGGLDAHLVDLERLSDLAPGRILPNHGDPEIIARGGYGEGLIRATQDYIRVLQRARHEPRLRAAALTELVGDSVAAGWITYFAPYEAVHQANLDAVTASPATAGP
jgi:glyoxylase-like metal-dependent hydrolase (beta-lactamase superfamily II)